MLRAHLILLALLSTILNAGTDNKDPIRIFPEAQEGYTRYVIELPKKADEADRRIELMVGKTILADCNIRSFTAHIQNRSLKGWGYSYLEFRDIRMGPSTMMACPDTKEEKFISVKDTLRRYNSRLPMVIYVPKTYRVKYRIWSADQQIQEATAK